MKSKTNYQLKDGDAVELVAPHKAATDYVYHADIGVGSYDNLYVLAGAKGTVVRARTPCVSRRRGDSHYFANVDVEVYPGMVVRVRCDHNYLKRLRRGARA